MPYIAGGTILNAPQRPLCADTKTVDDELFSGGYVSWPESLNEKTWWNTFRRPMILDMMTLDSKLFKTPKGYLGMGSDDVDPGDILCILYGGQMPFISGKREHH